MFCTTKKLHVCRSSSTGNNFDQFASNDGLSGAVVENLVLANHLTSVLGGILEQGIALAKGVPMRNH